MAKVKFYQVEKTINGVNYKAQFNGISQLFKMSDGCKINVGGALADSNEQTTQYVLDNVIVEPHGLTIDDFETTEELNEVIKWGLAVMQGKFRDNAENSNTAKTASRK